MTKIEKVWAREVLDSRGNPTVEAVVTVGGHEISAIAPSGASTGMYEALELRDGGNRYKGKGVLKAVENVRGPIAEAIVGMDPEDQKGIDAAIIAADGTDNKSRFGGNATTAVSFAVARAGAFAAGEELYEHIGKDHRTLPVPMFNIINGGKHAGGDLKIQECMIIPAGAATAAARPSTNSVRSSTERTITCPTCGARYGGSSSAKADGLPRSTVTRSAYSITSCILCEINTIDFPLSAIFLRVLKSLTDSCGVRTADGSSRIRTSAP